MVLASNAVMQKQWLAIDDYVEYWAAGKLNLTGGNPYDPDQLLPLQQQAGRYAGVPVIMYNPPWMLAIAMPFAALDYAIGRTIWLLLSIGLMILCSAMLWSIYGGPSDKRWLSWLFGLTFVPVLDCLRTGQTGIFLLTGLVGFLYFQRQNRDWLAGFCLSLLAIKPHILILFALAVLFWCIQFRRWKIIVAAVLALAAATLIAWLVNPSVIQQYIFLSTHYPPAEWATATFASFLRFLFGTRFFWLQFVPPVLGFIWFVFYWVQHRTGWDWLAQAPLLILVSVSTSAYGWTFDQPVILVAILLIFSRVFSHSINRSALIIIGTYLMIDAVDLLMRVPQLWLWWMAPILLLWYSLAQRILTNPISNHSALRGEPVA